MCVTAALGGLLLFAQCAPPAILKPKNRKTEKTRNPRWWWLHRSSGAGGGKPWWGGGSGQVKPASTGLALARAGRWRKRRRWLGWRKTQPASGSCACLMCIVPASPLRPPLLLDTSRHSEVMPRALAVASCLGRCPCWGPPSGLFDLCVTHQAAQSKHARSGFPDKPQRMIYDRAWLGATMAPGLISFHLA
jgi:hypothetical protein